MPSTPEKQGGVIPTEEFIEVGGTQYLRTRVDARIKRADPEKLPARVRHSNKAIASTLHFHTNDNPDLTWVQMILDTEGANANRDYMPRPSLLKGYGSAVYKPFDMDHTIIEDRSMVGMSKQAPPVRNTIYGVMTHAALARPDGTLLSDAEIADLDQSDDMKRGDDDKICVTVWAALYGFLFPKTVADVTDLIDAGTMHVSMERWIADWDFMVPDHTGTYSSVSRADAANTDLFVRWATGIASNDRPIYRRSLKFVYGGCASTTNPANHLCKFVSPSNLRAAASQDSTVNESILQNLMHRHCELHEAFAISSGVQQEKLIEEHTRVTRAIAALTGQV